MHKRDLFAQMVFSIIATLMPPIATNKVQSFYVEIFLIRAYFPLE